MNSLRIERHLPGVMTVFIDVPDKPVNVFDEELLRELSGLVEQIERDGALSLVVFRSGKESGFLAGADVKRIQQIADADEAETVLRAGQALFDRIAALKPMTVAVIHGPCLGGGLEFALACTHRVARDDAATRIGLPETQLGVVPGWGGTQRLPRQVGLERGLRMILEGQRLSAAKAASIGLVDFAAPPEGFEEAVQNFLADRLAGKPLRRRKPGLLARLRESWLGRRVVLSVARRRLALRARSYPALPAALRAVEAGLKRGHARGLQAERDEFRHVLFAPATRNLMELFFQRERARRPATWIADAAPQPVKTVAVLGAGTMGAGIAQLAAFSGFDVVLRDIRQDLVDEGMKRIGGLMQDAVRAGAMRADEAAPRLQRVTGTVDWEPVAKADVAIEAVVERLDVKRDVFAELDRRLPAESLLVSNTSALPIREMGAATGRAERVAGLHFFNPVHRMALVEVVRSERTSDPTIATLVELVRDLGKVPVVVSEGPGFLVNRVLFPYLDEAVRMACEGVSVEAVDREAKRFGMPMGPFELLDQVGLDVAADVARTLSPLSSEESPTPARLEEMAAKGQLGRKAGLGFYKYRDGRTHGVAKGVAGAGPKGSPGAPTGAGPQVSQPKLPAAARFVDGESLDGIGQRLMLSVINEAARCLGDGVVRDAWMVDLAMVLGTGFAPFRGGPLRQADAWGLDRVVATLDHLATTCGPRFQPCPLLRDMHRHGRKFHESMNGATIHREVATTAPDAVQSVSNV